MSNLVWPLLALVFLAGAIATWIASISLAKSTDALDNRFKLGEAIGGMILLSIVGTLPEITITVSAVIQGHLDLAAGSLIGGIAVQTVVLVICDAATGRKSSLSYLVGSLIPALEALLVVPVVSFVLMGALLKPTIAVGPLNPASIAIVVVRGVASSSSIASGGRRAGRRSHRAAGRDARTGAFHTRKPPLRAPAAPACESRSTS